MLTHKKINDAYQAPQHFLTGEELTVAELQYLLRAAKGLKQNRSSRIHAKILKGKFLALLFDKPSFRTRLSFSIAIQELGGNIIESCEQNRKNEWPEDQIRVLNGYCHAVMVRTHEHHILNRMATHAKIPMINGLSHSHHPCQILADLLILQEHYGQLKGLTVAYIGDGNNIMQSLLLIAPRLGINIHYACPETREPESFILAKAIKQAEELGSKIVRFCTPQEAVANANAVYTDSWISMGFEQKTQTTVFEGYQVNEALMALAAPKAIFMHCMPMSRGQEVSLTLPDDQSRSVIFQQSENRLHVQKALLIHLLAED